MTLEEAIEILRNPPFYPSTPSDKDYADAIKLGSEALQRIRHDRLVMQAKHILLLPGETKQ